MFDTCGGRRYRGGDRVVHRISLSGRSRSRVWSITSATVPIKLRRCCCCRLPCDDRVVVLTRGRNMGIGWRVPRRGERCVADRRQRRHNGARSHAITVWDERKKKYRRGRGRSAEAGCTPFNRRRYIRPAAPVCIGFFLVSAVIIAACNHARSEIVLCAPAGERERAEGWKCEKLVVPAGWRDTGRFRWQGNAIRLTRRFYAPNKRGYGSCPRDLRSVRAQTRHVADFAETCAR